MKIKGIFFDYGNTLINLDLDWEKVLPIEVENLTNYLYSVGIKVDKKHFGETFLELKQKHFLQAEKEQWEYKTTYTLEKALEKFGIRNVPLEILENAVDNFFAYEEKLATTFPGVISVLEKLKTLGYKMAVISNATCGRLIKRGLINRGLIQFFDEVIVSADVGFRKPHRRIYEIALESLKLAPTESVMIGDMLEIDLTGAKKLGMYTILVQFVNSPVLKSTSLETDNYQIDNKNSLVDGIAKNFQDILDILEKIEKTNFRNKNIFCF